MRHWLRRPWLAISAGLIGLVLLVAVLQLPQLPGQLVDEHAAAASWLVNTSTTYGVWGNLLLALGLFDVLRSPLLYLLLALLLPTLAAQLADQIGALRQLRGLQSYPLDSPSPSAGTAIPIAALRPLYRWRGLVQAPPDSVSATLESQLAAQYATRTRAQAPLLVPVPPQPNPALEEDEPSPVVEERLLGVQYPHLLFVRPLLMVGLLAAVVGAWIALAFGWQVTAPPLAPGATYRSANRNLELHYSISPTGTLTTALATKLQGEEVILTTDRATQQAVGEATIQVRPTYPGVWISTSDGRARLTLPGDPMLLPSVGLVFASLGSEESILIPDQGAGLRIVQRGSSNDFVLELYRSDALQPVYRAELTEGGSISLPFDPRDGELLITSVPGLQVDVRHLPGLFLVWCGIGFALLGALAFLRSSTFVLAQVAPWGADTSVVVLQSDHAETLTRLRTALEYLSAERDADQPDEALEDEALSTP